jgi:hypothetical protein
MESVCESGVYQAVPARKFNKPSMWFGLRRTDQQAQAWKSESEGRSPPTVLQIHLVRRSSSTEVGSRRAHGPRDRGDQQGPSGQHRSQTGVAGKHERSGGNLEGLGVTFWPTVRVRFPQAQAHRSSTNNFTSSDQCSEIQMCFMLSTFEFPQSAFAPG